MSRILLILGLTQVWAAQRDSFILHRSLLSPDIYNKNTHPDSKVTLNISFQLLDFDVDDNKQEVILLLEGIYQWKDPRLSWQGSGLDSDTRFLIVNASLIWIPHVEPIGVPRDHEGRWFGGPVFVSSDGSVLFRPLVTFRLPYQINDPTDLWPWVHRRSSIVLSTGAYPSSCLDFAFSPNDLIQRTYHEDYHQFEINFTAAERLEDTYRATGNETFALLKVTFQFIPRYIIRRGKLYTSKQKFVEDSSEEDLS